MRRSAASMSAAFHVAAVAGLLLFDPAGVVVPKRDGAPVRYTLIYNPPPRVTRAEGGGGQRDVLPASRGRLPPRAAQRVFTPPAARILNENPRLPLAQAILLDADMPDVPMDRIGNPLGVDGPLSGGRGGPAGIGEGGCCGVGDAKGPGIDGDKPNAGAVKAQHFNLPVLVYKVDPEYSEEARKAKFQGVVVIVAEVDASGRTRNPHVVRSLGLGLDERAVAAANLWRFRPAMADGKAVSYIVTIEVNFRLL